jgi:hypothetical protein
MEKDMYRVFVSIAVCLAMLALSGEGASAQIPFERHGVIHRLSAYQGFIVIDDVTYLLPPTARVYIFEGKTKRPTAPGKEAEKEPEYGTTALLREGMHIGYRVEGEGSGRRGRVVEAWILRPGSLPKSRG